MTGDGARDDWNSQALDADGDGSEKSDDLLRLEKEMSPLLAAVGAFAREEEGEIGTYAANTSHGLSDVAREAAVQKILALQARERAERSATAGPELPRAGAPITVVRDIPRKPRRMGSLLVVGGGLVAAAVVLALWIHPTPQEPSLPPYSIAARGGIKEARGATPADAEPAQAPGDTAAEQRLNDDSVLVVAARPETAVTGAVGARAFVIQGNDATEIAPNAQVAPTGAIALRFPGAELIGSRQGPANLRVIVGRPEALRTFSTKQLSDTTDARWRVLTVPLRLDRR